MLNTASSLSALEKQVWAALVDKRIRNGKLNRRTQARLIKKLALISPERAQVLWDSAEARK